MRGFIDLHLHVSLTDQHGAWGEAACQELVQAAEQLEMQGLVFTPHVDVYQPAAIIQEDVIATQAHCQGLATSVIIDTASELLLRAPTDVLLPLQGHAHTYPGSRHILVEFLPQASPSFIVDCIYELSLRLFVPVIAHPERLQIIGKQPEQAAQLVDAGAILQGTFASLVGYHGARVRDVLLYLLKYGYVHSLASDYHGGGYEKLCTQALEVLQRHLSTAAIEELLCQRPGLLVALA